MRRCATCRNTRLTSIQSNCLTANSRPSSVRSRRELFPASLEQFARSSHGSVRANALTISAMQAMLQYDLNEPEYTEKSLGIRFFQRQGGRYFPTPEARNIFEQINGVYKKVDDLTEIISKIGHGALSELRIGSVPSISQVMVPRAIE